MPKCVACDGNLEFFGPRSKYEYHICKSCGSIQLFPMPTGEELAEAYRREYSSANQAEEFCDPQRWKDVARPYHESIMTVLRDYAVTGPVVDFGAGWGYLCQMLNANGFECYGCEPSEVMAARCRNAGIPVEMGSLEVVESRGKPASAIVMCAVFEHLTEHRNWLQRANAVLKKGGYLISLHPTAACYRLLAQILRLNVRRRELPELHGTFSPPWHTALFSLKAMDVLAKNNGYEIAEIRRAPQGRIGGALGGLQMLLAAINRVGWFFVGKEWPLVTSHIFVLRKL